MEQRTTEKRANYLGIFILLAVFTLVETLLSYLQQEIIKVPLLIGLSALKAILVLLYFMHLKFDNRIFSYLFIAGLLLPIPLILIITVVMPALVPK
jgi:cytochrome c oxidase subunit 4